MKNTIKKRIVALGLIGALCIPTAAIARESKLTGGVGKYYGAHNIHYAWADHLHYEVGAKLTSGGESTDWHWGWQQASSDNLYGTSGKYYYQDDTAYHEIKF